MDRDSWIAVLQIVKMVLPILLRQGLLAISELGIESSISSSEGSPAICFLDTGQHFDPCDLSVCIVPHNRLSTETAEARC